MPLKMNAVTYPCSWHGILMFIFRHLCEAHEKMKIHNKMVMTWEVCCVVKSISQLQDS